MTAAGTHSARHYGIVLALTMLAAAALMLLLMPAVGASASGPAISTASASGTSVQLSAGILAKSQSAVAGGQVRVDVSLRSRGKSAFRPVVTLKIQVKQNWSGWTLAGTKKIKVRTGGSSTVGIPMNKAARSIALNCGAPQVRLMASVRSGGKTQRRTVTTPKLRGESFRCTVPLDVDLSKAEGCDFIASFKNPCLAPFPNNYYTRADESSGTGLRVDLAVDSTPQNASDNHIDVTALNQSDGFSPGQSITIQIPGMDNPTAFSQTGIVPEGELSKAFEPNQPALLIDAMTGERQLIWGELDSNATADKDRNLIIRPGRNLIDGHRYIVALRNMKNASGAVLPAPPGFRMYRDNKRTDNLVVEAQRNRYESIFRVLGRADVRRSSLYLAWDFTVASTENLTGRMLSIRDRAFTILGDTDLDDGVIQGEAPEFLVTDVNNSPSTGLDRVVTGTFQVPCFLNEPGCPTGSTFDLDADENPIRTPGNEFTARFKCNIPDSAIVGGEVDQTVRPSLYGHGLFNEYFEVNSGNVRAMGNENQVMNCATDWIGMSASDDLNPFHDDIPTAISALQDLSLFPTIPDRLQQGFLNFTYLARLLIHPDGFTSDPSFRYAGESVIDTEDVFYWGNSQGGIAGGAFTAISPDVTRSVLYVPGMNYSTLLTRSIDFTQYAAVLYPSYERQIERPLIFSLMQMVWDRGEPNGYANHMTDNPLPNTPPHKVMLVMAWGDHEVANVATEVEARTIGAPLRSPTLDSSRLAPGMLNPFYDHEILGDLSGPAADGNAFFIWDTGPKRSDPPGTPIGNTVNGFPTWGTNPAPLANIPPSRSFGQNPHDTVVQESNLARKLIADFINTNGKVTNPCGAGPCYAAGWNGFP
ncbi:MAG: hypothetical protein WD181_02655 [Solirubrobacterales bacterium]